MFQKSPAGTFPHRMIGAPSAEVVLMASPVQISRAARTSSISITGILNLAVSRRGASPNLVASEEWGQSPVLSYVRPSGPRGLTVSPLFTASLLILDRADAHAEVICDPTVEE